MGRCNWTWACRLLHIAKVTAKTNYYTILSPPLRCLSPNPTPLEYLMMPLLLRALQPPARRSEAHTVLQPPLQPRDCATPINNSKIQMMTTAMMFPWGFQPENCCCLLAEQVQLARLSFSTFNGQADHCQSSVFFFFFGSCDWDKNG